MDAIHRKIAKNLADHSAYFAKKTGEMLPFQAAAFL